MNQCYQGVPWPRSKRDTSPCLAYNKTAHASDARQQTCQVDEYRYERNGVMLHHPTRRANDPTVQPPFLSVRCGCENSEPLVGALERKEGDMLHLEETQA